MSTFFRSDGWVKSVLGNAIAGAQIYICLQPADASFLPPIPLASVFSDPAGLSPVTQPIITDGFGHYDFYAASGIPYSVVVVNQGKLQQIYTDQVPMGATIGSSGGGAVSSVFGRTGDVVAQAGDYGVAQITGAAPLASPNFTGTIQIVNASITGTLKDGTGVVGTPGQLLSSTGTGTSWVTPGFTSQADVTASRVLGTVYKNTTGKPLFVSVSAHGSNSSTGSIVAITDANSSPSTNVAFQGIYSTANDSQITMMVLPGNFYKVFVNVGTPSLGLWIEWN
jgi:hypothetical protein